jgi:hypothetical protein
MQWHDPTRDYITPSFVTGCSSIAVLLSALRHKERWDYIAIAVFIGLIATTWREAFRPPTVPTDPERLQRACAIVAPLLLALVTFYALFR